MVRERERDKLNYVDRLRDETDFMKKKVATIIFFQ